jgi:hypothetical protein
MSLSRVSRFKAFSCAPAVMVLATVVNAAASERLLPERFEPHAADLSWAMDGGATHSVQIARVKIARQAATTIHSMDRLCGAQHVHASQIVPDTAAIFSRSASSFTHNELSQDHAASTHQHSAP